MSEYAHLIWQLATRAGITDEYFDQAGNRRLTSDLTRQRILAALGIDVSSVESARAALDEQDREAAAELIAPVRVLERGDPAICAFHVRTPAGRTETGPWRLEIETETGGSFIVEGPWRGESSFRINVLDGDQLPIGYHRVTFTIRSGGDEWTAEQTLIIVPKRCVTPDELLDGSPAFGVIANLYSIRSRRNWGVGDFTDLLSLVQWTASIDGDFVGINPLHALLDRDNDISPYRPISRLFRNPIYIDIGCVPELTELPELAERLASPEFVAELESIRAKSRVAYDQVMAVKGLALDMLHRGFVETVRGSGSERDRAYSEFLMMRGRALDRFAVWMTIAEQHGADWHTWPETLQNPASEGVRAFALEHEGRVDFHRWVQFEIDEQLRRVSAEGQAAELRLGLYQDLAIGSSPSGADTWCDPGLFVHGVSVGAPPDPYSATGQNWGLPPIDPRALRRDRYRYFIDLIRAGLRHSGALRVDHVMGLFRLFWIPDGLGAEHGAYVRYPSGDLLGILALESVRHNALIVGEDLGTVPPEVPIALHKWGILSSKVLYFEREHDGRFKPATSYPALSLATANTHDMPTLAAFWSGHDIGVRRGVGLINEAEEQHEHANRERDRGALIDLLRAEQILPQGHTPRSTAELRTAVHRFLWSTPAQLVGFSLDDIAGEVEPVNVPGVGQDRFPSWTRRMHVDLETIVRADDDSQTILKEWKGRVGG